jgi:hypothetical protein
VIVADDCSPDRTPEMLARVRGIRVERNATPPRIRLLCRLRKTTMANSPCCGAEARTGRGLS